MRQRLWFSLLIVASLTGCATYHHLPLITEAVNKALAAPDMEEVRVEATRIKHPVMKPIDFDYRDGIGPDEAAVLAVIANPALRALRDRRGVAEAEVIEAGILPNPQLSYGLETPVGGGRSNRVNAFTAGLGWDITAILARSARLEAARKKAASIDLEVAWGEWQAAEAAKLNLYRWTLARRRLSLVSKLKKLYSDYYLAVRRAVELGERTAPDLARAMADYEGARRRETEVRARAERSRLELNRAVGLPPSTVIKTERDIPVPYLRTLPQARAFIKGLEERRLDLIALRLGYESAEAGLRAEIRSRFPKISLSLKGARDTDNVQTAGAEVAIDIPPL